MIYEDEQNPQENFEERPSHISYKEYKKKLNSNPNEGLILFVSAFFALVILFLGIAKQISPDVDVSIADNNEETVMENDDNGTVDSRLKLLQNEDNDYISDDTFSPELEEKVQLPKIKRKTVGEPEKEAEVVVLGEDKKLEPPSQTKQVASPKPSANPKTVEEQPFQPINSQQSVSAKVIVGYYATQAQAEVAKGIIQEAGLNIQPFVKNIGGAYTLQVGSFSSKEKAQSVANDLLKNNFPARVVVE